MRFTPKHPGNANERKQLLIDIAAALLSGGKIDLDVTFALNQSDGQVAAADNFDFGVVQLLILETYLKANNGTQSYLLNAKSVEDTSRKIIVHEKATKGHLILTLDYGSNVTANTLEVQQTDMDDMETVISRICDDYEVIAGFGVNNGATSGVTINGATTNLIIGFGTLKETQDGDYNPLTGLATDYVIINPDKFVS